MASMIRGTASPRLKFCLEPEAALLNVAITSNYLRAGARVLLLDMGGGTVDLAAFELSSGTSWHGFNMTEIAPGEGCTAGSTHFDDAFVQFIRALVGDDTYDATVRRYPVVADHLHQQWMRVKHGFEGDADASYRISIHPQLMAALALPKIMQLEQANVLAPATGKLRFTGQDIIDCFDTVFPTIVAVAEEMLAKCRKARRPITHLVCVGGFAQMTYMQERVTAEFSGRGFDIYFDPSGASAVVRGALLYGLNPEVMSRRRARHSYGLEVATVYRRSAYCQFPGHEKYVEGEGIEARIKIFYPIIKINGDLPLNVPVRKYLHPSGPHQTEVLFTVYVSRSPEVPQFIDETCRPILTVQFPCNMTPNLYAADTKFPFDLLITDSEIRVRAFDGTNRGPSGGLLEYIGSAQFNPFARPGPGNT
ncbi:hypothetical protein H9P43_002712 [Blastocladiella emersonii ATCC 22665]|nr:hypothetical protein H9P43_002712 [Blastocladiella emersonii ATCC 22665]